MTSKIWITWEDHRRSRVLSSEFGCKYIPVTLDATRLLRYPVLSFLTVLLIIKERPKYLFCQNPSIILAAICAILKFFYRYKLIVDRHSNFKTETQGAKSLKWKIFHIISGFSIRHSDLTIVTNEHIKNLVYRHGGKAVVLPDKIPRLESSCEAPVFFNRSYKKKVVCITMFDDDEPINEMVESASYIKEKATLFFTGNYKKVYREKDRVYLENHGALFCGFVDEPTYQAMLAHSDVVIVLTKKDHILNCGAYEALAARKPLILSKTPTLEAYFGNGPIYVNPTNPHDIYEAILYALDNNLKLRHNIESCRDRLSDSWDVDFKYTLRELGWY